MSIYRYCHSCNWWRWDSSIITEGGRIISRGHCGLESCACINAVTTGKTPPPHYQRIELTVDEWELNEREETHTV